MTVTLNLSAETERLLAEKASKEGLTLTSYLQTLVERHARSIDGAPAQSAASKLDEVLAPFRQEVKESGMTDEELRDFLIEVRDEVRAEKREQRSTAQ
jgi:hypothetical protein